LKVQTLVLHTTYHLLMTVWLWRCRHCTQHIIYLWQFGFEGADIGLAHNTSYTDRGIMYQFYFEIPSCHTCELSHFRRETLTFFSHIFKDFPENKGYFHKLMKSPYFWCQNFLLYLLQILKSPSFWRKISHLIIEKSSHVCHAFRASIKFRNLEVRDCKNLWHWKSHYIGKALNFGSHKPKSRSKWLPNFH
jgi:hypothetical protein